MDSKVEASECEPDFPSGPWTGFWLQPERHRQDMNLTFAHGVLRGRGSDGIGPFLVAGRYDAETKKVWWTKSYPGSHDVFYQGYREYQGIWGTWQISSMTGLALSVRGGFRIWPRGQGSGDAESVSAEVDAPVTATTRR
jgi:hypothetical protein